MNRNTYFETETGACSGSSIEYLSAAEEAELSRRILAGGEAEKTLAEGTSLAESELETLRQTAADGRLAYEKLVLANEPRAVKTALETMRKNSRSLDDFEDYRQTAMQVICRCAKSFDWRLGVRFGTYVHRSLQHEMMRENAKMGYAFRIPEEQLPAAAALRKLSAEKGRVAAAGSMGLDGTLADILLEAANSCSLQAPVSAEDPDTELGDLIPDAHAVSAEEICDRIDLQARIDRLMAAFAKLPEAERELLKGRMGFYGEKRPMRDYVGIAASTLSGVQKKQEAAGRHLRKLFSELPAAG